MKDRLSNVFGGFEFGQGAALAQIGKGPKYNAFVSKHVVLTVRVIKTIKHFLNLKKSLCMYIYLH
jgi:hypothetical protein